jgi:DNA-binding NtrC family response regulator
MVKNGYLVRMGSYLPVDSNDYRIYIKGQTGFRSRRMPAGNNFLIDRHVSEGVMPVLSINKGRAEVRRFSFAGDVVTIGRDSQNADEAPDLSLPDTSRKVSRYHAALVRDKNGACFIRDLGSANGTTVNNRPVYSRRLREGDRIGIGEFTLTYSEREPPPADLAQAILVADTSSMAGQLEKTTLLENAPEAAAAQLSDSRRQVLHDILHRLISRSHATIFHGELLTCAGEALRARRGMIAGIESPFALTPVSVLGIDVACGEQMRVSAPQIHQALATGSAVASFFAGVSVLCCPLPVSIDRPGVIYLEGGRSGFLEDDRVFLDTLCKRLYGVILQKAAHDESVDGDVPAERCLWNADMVARNPVMKRVLADIDTCAHGAGNVLLRGETGTGKEIAARAIHARSSRATAPFVPVELSGLEKEMVSSTLFGWEKGSFTGADKSTPGAFERADAIGDITLDVQAKLRRAVEKKEIFRVGSALPIKVDVKIIAATNVDLDRAVAEGTFRGDLLQRFGTHITLPPLRERVSDISLLACYFIDQLDLPLRALSHGALRLMLKYDWPGNVRELREIIKELAAKGKEIVFSFDLPDRIQQTARTGEASGPGTIQEIEKQEIIRVLALADWNMSQATHILGYGSKQTLYNKIKKYNIPRPPRNCPADS